MQNNTAWAYGKQLLQNRRLDTVIEFETSVTFSKDKSMDDRSLWDIARISDRPGPISISNVKIIGFKKQKKWWQFWKK